MRAPEERRLRKYLGRQPVPEDPAKAAEQREALAASKAVEEAAQQAEEQAVARAAADEEARAKRRELRKKTRAEQKAKALKFLRCVS